MTKADGGCEVGRISVHDWEALGRQPLARVRVLEITEEFGWEAAQRFIEQVVADVNAAGTVASARPTTRNQRKAARRSRR